MEDITEALWGSKVSPATISELNKKAYVHIEDWRNRPLQGGRYPYVYVDGIYLRRNWGGDRFHPHRDVYKRQGQYNAPFGKVALHFAHSIDIYPP